MWYDVMWWRSDPLNMHNWKQAMPGGKVLIFTGLKQCVTTEEELAAVVSVFDYVLIVSCQLLVSDVPTL